ncbi:hypothetical protein AD998_09990 [bacterium 336/3]|nr:hypothetical protein AD998_09990 [bacterium 336/3]
MINWDKRKFKPKKKYAKGILYKDFNFFDWKGEKPILQTDSVLYPWIEYVKMDDYQEKIIIYYNPIMVAENKFIKQSDYYYRIYLTPPINDNLQLYEAYIFKKDKIYNVCYNQVKGKKYLFLLSSVNKNNEIEFMSFDLEETMEDKGCLLDEIIDNHLGCLKTTKIDEHYTGKLNINSLFWDAYATSIVLTVVRDTSLLKNKSR